LIDFDKGIRDINKFGGSEVKVTLIYEGDVYMLKYPDPIRGDKYTLSYKNNQYSEYVGSHIFMICGFKTHETYLGYYTNEKGTRKLVVGCKDFTAEDKKLYEFKYLQNESDSEKKLKISFETVDYILSNHFLTKQYPNLLNEFYNMFIIDCLIGNSDRHFSNWGLLRSNGKDIEFAPIYDCGSSLAALLSDEDMEINLDNPTLFKSREYNITSVYTYNGKRIFYHEMFKNPTDNVKAALLRVFPKIDLEKIYSFIDGIEVMSDIRKEYMKEAITLRYNEILKPAYNKATIVY